MRFIIKFALKWRLYDQGREREIKSFADKLGFSFIPQTELSAFPVFVNFEMYEGNPHKFENFMAGTWDENRSTIFDLVYRNHGNYNSGTTTSRQTMFVIESEKLNLPELYLRPEKTGAKILGGLSRLDIDFAERPDFSKKFLLYGKDERAIRQLFYAKFFDYFEKNPNTYLFGCKQFVNVNFHLKDSLHIRTNFFQILQQNLHLDRRKMPHIKSDFICGIT